MFAHALVTDVLDINQSNQNNHFAWTLSVFACRLCNKPDLLPFVEHHTSLTPGPEGENLMMQFLIDPSTCPLMIKAVQLLGTGIFHHLLYLTRTWCHSHHLKRKRLLKYITRLTRVYLITLFHNILSNIK